jgi:hypothetical protein
VTPLYQFLIFSWPSLPFLSLIDIKSVMISFILLVTVSNQRILSSSRLTTIMYCTDHSIVLLYRPCLHCHFVYSAFKIEFLITFQTTIFAMLNALSYHSTARQMFSSFVTRR